MLPSTVDFDVDSRQYSCRVVRSWLGSRIQSRRTHAGRNAGTKRKVSTGIEGQSPSEPGRPLVPETIGPAFARRGGAALRQGRVVRDRSDRDRDTALVVLVWLTSVLANPADRILSLLVGVKIAQGEFDELAIERRLDLPEGTERRHLIADELRMIAGERDLTVGIHLIEQIRDDVVG